MGNHFVRRRMLSLAALGSAITMVACGDDSRVKKLDAGITRDSAVTVIGKDPKGGGRDSFPNVYKRDRYLIDGKSYEVLYFTADNVKITADSSVPPKKLTPLVFVDNRLVGKGWETWDSVSKAHKIPLVKR